MTTLSYIYVAESQFKSVRWSWAATTKGICLIWSRGRLLPPSLPCRGQGIGKQLGTTSSRHKRSTGRNLVVHRHGTALRQSVPGGTAVSWVFVFSLSLFQPFCVKHAMWTTQWLHFSNRWSQKELLRYQGNLGEIWLTKNTMGAIFFQ